MSCNERTVYLGDLMAINKMTVSFSVPLYHACYTGGDYSCKYIPEEKVPVDKTNTVIETHLKHMLTRKLLENRVLCEGHVVGPDDIGYMIRFYTVRPWDRQPEYGSIKLGNLSEFKMDIFAYQASKRIENQEPFPSWPIQWYIHSHS